MSRGVLKLNKSWVSLSLEQLLIGAIAIGILLRVINLGSREFWYDEVISLLLSTGHRSAYSTPGDLPVVVAKLTSALSLPPDSSLTQTVVNLLRGIVGGEPHPPVFFLSEHVWLRLFGNSEPAMRSLIAILSAIGIGGAYGLGRLLLDHRGGLILAALLATNPFFLFHSLNLRMYGGQVPCVILSAWALLELIYQQDAPESKRDRRQILWNVLLIGSVATGLLTFYLFAYWIVVLAAVALYLDRRHWWQHGLRLGTGILLTIPWLVWGTRQQLRNADLNRFGKPAGFAEAMLKHLQDVAETLGTHLLLGDWVTSLPSNIPLIAGLVTIALLLAGTISLRKDENRKLLAVTLLLSIFPILLALGVDIVTGKFTLGFGWGRSMILILPGCLLLITVWLQRAAGRWQGTLTAVFLLLYLSISVGDFSLRHRQVFHRVADIISQEPTKPTLIAMNSKAWGHVLRLAYYIPPSAPVQLLAQSPADLAPSLEKVLKNENTPYSRVVWLDSADPVWSRLKTEAEKETEKRRMQQVLQAGYQLTKQQPLSGTMDLDKFTVSLYNRSL